MEIKEYRVIWFDYGLGERKACGDSARQKNYICHNENLKLYVKHGHDSTPGGKVSTVKMVGNVHNEKHCNA